MNILKWLSGLFVGVISITFLKVNLINTEELNFNLNLAQATPTTAVNITTKIESTQANNLPAQTQTTHVRANCENQSTYECERLTQMKALANIAEQHHVNVSRTSTAVNGQIVQDVIHTETHALVTDTQVIENTENNYQIKATAQ